MYFVCNRLVLAQSLSSRLGCMKFSANFHMN
jgi:hypothetical protein